MEESQDDSSGNNGWSLTVSEIVAVFILAFSMVCTYYINLTSWNFLWVNAKLIFPNFLSDTKYFDVPCNRIFIPVQTKYLFERYKENTTDFLNSFINEFSVNTNQDSIDELKFALNCFNGFNAKRMCPSLTPYIREHRSMYYKELPAIKRQFPELKSYGEEVFHFVHGLRFAHEKIKEYVKKRDVFDVGAYVGDSATILATYTDKKVYSYELSPKFVDTITNAIKKFNNEGKILLVNAGMSDKPGTTKINDVNNAGGSLSLSGEVLVNITTIDEEVKRTGAIPGFIKADVEGFGLKVIQGADKSIEKYRPVIEIACYHNYDELFELPRYMKKYQNYLFEFHSENDNYGSMGEMAFFAYPAEILYPSKGIYEELKE